MIEIYTKDDCAYCTMAKDLVDIEMREELIDDLNKGFVKVTFTKKDGTERVMNCTLKSEYLPEDYKSDVAPDAEKKVNRNILAVWDIDVSGWRSFRVDSVKDFLWSRYPETLEPSEVEGHPV